MSKLSKESITEWRFPSFQFKPTEKGNLHMMDTFLRASKVTGRGKSIINPELTKERLIDNIFLDDSPFHQKNF